MSLFLRKFSFFVLPIALLLILSEIYSRQTESTYKAKERELEKNASKVEILILGNSHATYAVNPNEFSKYTFNSAQVGQSLYFDKRITMKHMDELTNLKYVLICLDFHSFSFSTQFQRNYWSYYSNGIEYKDELVYYKKYSQLLGYTPKVLLKQLKSEFDKTNKAFKAIDVENGVNCYTPIAKGFFSFMGTDERMMNKKKYEERANYFNKMVKESKERDSIVADFESFISFLKAKNITPVFVSTPCYKPYRELLGQQLLIKNNAKIGELSKKYNVQYWNYFDLIIDKSCFYNCDHLNGVGARVFSQILNKRVEALK